MNKRKLFLSLALFLMAGSTLSAQNKSAGINLSIWKGVSTQPADSAQTTYFNLGILSAMNRLNGAGFNAFGSVISHNMNGIQASGLANMVGGSMRGLQLSAISNINGNNMIGFSATGLVNIAGNESKGDEPVVEQPDPGQNQQDHEDDDKDLCNGGILALKISVGTFTNRCS